MENIIYYPWEKEAGGGVLVRHQMFVREEGPKMGRKGGKCDCEMSPERTENHPYKLFPKVVTKRHRFRWKIVMR